MKNIHVIPTDKPSRIIASGKEFNLLSKSTIDKRCQNIYITNNEEIKEGDYGLSKLNEIVKFHSNYDYRHYKKIILTTDVDLIKNGVQSIPDDFLKWFVNNPSCEVAVEFIQTADYSKDGFYYQITISKEPITDDSWISPMQNFSLKEQPKQETIEEIAFKLFPKKVNNIFSKENEEKRGILRKGAEIQSKRMYSEEEVRIMFKKYQNQFPLHRNVQVMTSEFNQFFEQFKK